MDRKNIIETFMYKVHDEGLNYALENYSNDLATLDVNVAEALVNYNESLDELKQEIITFIKDSVEDNIVDEKDAKDFLNLL